MTYVISDLHGYALASFLALLKKADFSDKDECLILGDVIDRGEEGAKLLEWLTYQTNVRLILGNHEAMMLSCRFLFDEITDESVAALSEERMMLWMNWMENGAEPTLRGMRALIPDVRAEILEYLDDCPLYETLTVAGRRFLLTHSGLGSFRAQKPLSSYRARDLLWHRPTPNERYFEDVTTVFGHTPTHYLDPSARGRVLHGDTFIAIDTGAAEGGLPTLLRLDDMAEFRAD